MTIDMTLDPFGRGTRADTVERHVAEKDDVVSLALEKASGVNEVFLMEDYPKLGIPTMRPYQIAAFFDAYLSRLERDRMSLKPEEALFITCMAYHSWLSGENDFRFMNASDSALNRMFYKLCGSRDDPIRVCCAGKMGVRFGEKSKHVIYDIQDSPDISCGNGSSHCVFNIHHGDLDYILGCYSSRFNVRGGWKGNFPSDPDGLISCEFNIGGPVEDIEFSLMSDCMIRLTDEAAYEGLLRDLGDYYRTDGAGDPIEIRTSPAASGGDVLAALSFGRHSPSNTIQLVKSIDSYFTEGPIYDD